MYNYESRGTDPTLCMRPKIDLRPLLDTQKQPFHNTRPATLSSKTELGLECHIRLRSWKALTVELKNHKVGGGVKCAYCSLGDHRCLLLGGGVREQQLAGVQHVSCFSSDLTHPDGAISCLPKPGEIIPRCSKSDGMRCRIDTTKPNQTLVTSCVIQNN